MPQVEAEPDHHYSDNIHSQEVPPELPVDSSSGDEESVTVTRRQPPPLPPKSTAQQRVLAHVPVDELTRQRSASRGSSSTHTSDRSSKGASDSSGSFIIRPRSSSDIPGGSAKTIIVPPEPTSFPGALGIVSFVGVSSPAAQAGLETGDIMLEFATVTSDSESLSTFFNNLSLIKQIAHDNIQRKVRLRFSRDGSQIEAAIIPGVWDHAGKDFLGFALRPLIKYAPSELPAPRGARPQPPSRLARKRSFSTAPRTSAPHTAEPTHAQLEIAQIEKSSAAVRATKCVVSVVMVLHEKIGVPKNIQLGVTYGTTGVELLRRWSESDAVGLIPRVSGPEAKRVAEKVCSQIRVYVRPDPLAPVEGGANTVLRARRGSVSGRRDEPLEPWTLLRPADALHAADAAGGLVFLYLEGHKSSLQDDLLAKLDMHTLAELFPHIRAQHGRHLPAALNNVFGKMGRKDKKKGGDSGDKAGGNLG